MSVDNCFFYKYPYCQCWRMNTCRICPVGPAGPEGPQGVQGEAGPAGPPGSLILAAATFFSTAFATVPFDSAIPINSGERIVGDGLSLINATDVLIENPGVYLVSYYFQGDPIGDIETVACSLRLNNATVPGSIVQSVTSFMSSEVEPAVSNSCIIQTVTDNAILQIHNSSNSAISHIRWVDDFCSASLTIIRLS